MLTVVRQLSMRVSIITAVFNRLDLTREFWASLEQNPPPEPWEIIWVDDGSTDGARDWLRTLPAPRHRVLLNGENLGYASSNNRAAAIATGPVLALLNNDLVLTSGWFAPMAEVLRRFPRLGLVGNVQDQASTGAVDHSGIYFYARGKPTHDRTLPATFPEQVRPVLAATAACVLVARERFQELGGFDEGFRNGGEDVDLCLRARAKGWQNYVALDSRIRHHVSASPGRDLHNQRNACRLMRRWRETIPSLAAESWREVALRDRWEHKLKGWAWLRARLTRASRRRPEQECPLWMQRATQRMVERQLAVWRPIYPE